mgnify:CR=1 FL=1
MILRLLLIGLLAAVGWYYLKAQVFLWQAGFDRVFDWMSY